MYFYFGVSDLMILLLMLGSDQVLRRDIIPSKISCDGNKTTTTTHDVNDNDNKYDDDNDNDA